MKQMSSRGIPSHPNEHAQVLNITFTKIRNHIEVIYIKVREGIGDHCTEVDESGDIVLNFDKENNLLGIELLTPIPLEAASQLMAIAKEYHHPELESLNPHKLEEAFA